MARAKRYKRPIRYIWGKTGRHTQDGLFHFYPNSRVVHRRRITDWTKRTGQRQLGFTIGPERKRWPDRARFLKRHPWWRYMRLRYKLGKPWRVRFYPERYADDRYY